MDKKEIIVNRNVNFVAEVSSVFHLLSAVSYAYKKSKNGFINGIVFIRSHYVMNAPIAEQVIEFENLRLELINYKTDYKNIELAEEKDSEEKQPDGQNGEMYILSVKVPNYSLFSIWRRFTNKKIRVVVVDEGTGTYYNFSGFLYPFNTLIKTFLIALKGSKVEKYFILRKENGKLVSNENVIADFVDLMSGKIECLFNISEKFKKQDSSEEFAIFISGLFVEMGLITLENYKKKLYEVKKILEGNGIKLLIKPYQSEDLEKYKELDIELLQWEIPCEILFPVMKPVYTLGFLSTSMLTGKVLYNIESIDLSNVFGLEDNRDYHSKYEKMFKLFENFIKRCDNFREFSELIKNKRK